MLGSKILLNNLQVIIHTESWNDINIQFRNADLV